MWLTAWKVVSNTVSVVKYHNGIIKNKIRLHIHMSWLTIWKIVNNIVYSHGLVIEEKIKLHIHIMTELITLRDVICNDFFLVASPTLKGIDC